MDTTPTDPPTTPVRFDTKIAVLLRDDLAVWQRLNVTAFLVSGLGHAHPEVIGAEPFRDADGNGYTHEFRQPVLVFEGDRELMTTAHGKARSRGVTTAVFTAEMFLTDHDDANRAAVAAVPAAKLDLVGIAVYGPKNAVDKVLKGARMHP